MTKQRRIETLEEEVLRLRAELLVTRNTLDLFKRSNHENANKANNLESEVRSKEEKMKFMKLDFATKLQGIQMFLDVMASGHTHREKGLFATQAKNVLSQATAEVIGELKNELNIYPF